MGTNWQGEKILSLNVFLQDYPSGTPLSPSTRLDLPWLVGLFASLLGSDAPFLPLS